MIKEKTYKAFISYSHADKKFGEWLHRALEKYKIPEELRKDYPNLPKSLFPLFRDREELSTSADLGTEILKALHHSEYLIIICSINSAKSQWVNQEIIDFKKIHGEDKVHAIIINGEPYAKESDEFDDDLECFPEALKYEVIDGKLSNIPTEPIAGDFRKGKDGKEYGKLKLISGLLGVKFDELNRREEKRKRRNRLIWGIFSIVLFAIMAGLTIYSLIQKNRAEKNEAKIRNELYLNSMQQGVIQRDFFNESIKARHIFAKTISISPDKEKAKSAKIAYNNLNTSKVINIGKHFSTIKGVVFDKNGTQILSWDKNGTVKLWNEKSKKSRIIIKHKREVYNAFFSNDGKKVLSKDKDGNVKFWSEKSHDRLLIHSKNIWTWDCYGASFSKNSDIVIFWGDTKFVFWNLKIDRKRELMFDTNIQSVSFSNDEQEVLIATKKNIYILNRRNQKFKLIKIIESNDSIDKAFYSPINRYILYLSHYKIYMWDKFYRKSKKIISHKFIVSGVLFDKNETKVISWSHWNRDRTIRIWDKINGEKVITKFKDIDNYGSRVLLSSNGQYIVSCDKHKIFIWDSKNNIFVTTKSGKINLFKKRFSILSMFHFFDDIAFDSKEENIIYKENDTIYIWNIAQNKILPLIKNISDFLISEDKKYILAWDSLGNLKLRNEVLKKTDKIVKHNSEILGANFNFDCSKIVSWDKNGNIKLLMRKNKDESLKLLDYINRYKTRLDNLGVSFSKDGKELLIWNQPEGVKLLDIKNNNIKLIIPFEKSFNSKAGKISTINAFFNKDEQEVASGSIYGVVKLLDRKTDTIRTIIEFNSSKNQLMVIEKIIYNRDENLILAWCRRENYEIKLWNRDTNKSKTIIRCNKEGIFKAKFNHKGDQVLALCRNGKLKLWDKNTDKLNVIFNNKGFFNTAEFTEDDKYILIWGSQNNTKEEKKVRIWNQDNKTLTTILTYDYEPEGFIFNKKYNEILFYGIDKSVKLYNLKTKNITKIIDLTKSYSSKAKYGNNGDIVFALGNNVIKIWNRKKNKIIDRIQSIDINSFQLNSNSNKILYWNSSEIRIYDMTLKKDIFKLQSTGIKKVEFSEDETKLLISSRFGFVQKYNLYSKSKLSKDYVLETEVLTGTYLTPLREVKALSNEDWENIKNKYNKKENRNDK